MKDGCHVCGKKNCDLYNSPNKLNGEDCLYCEDCMTRGAESLDNVVQWVCDSFGDWDAAPEEMKEVVRYHLELINCSESKFLRALNKREAGYK